MNAWHITAAVEDDICLATRYGSANEYVSEDYIPGSAVWGALARCTGIRPEAEPDEPFRTVFYSNQVRFLNLYPLVGTTGRALPVPRSARHRKSAPGFDTDRPLFAIEDDTGRGYLQSEGVRDWLTNGAPEDADEWQRVDGFYGPLYHQGGQPGTVPRVAASPAMVLNGHVDRSTRAGVAREGRLFSRHDLARGERFIGAIVAMTDAGQQALGEVLTRTNGFSGRIRIGRQPGHAILKLHKDRILPWADAPQEFGDGTAITVTLLSHAIIMDEWLRGRTDLPSDLVAAGLGLEEGFVLPERHFSSTIALQGWNGAYNRARELDVAIAMGSAFLFRVDWPEEISPEERQKRMAELQVAGVGLRRSEGFGEIRVNDPFHQIHANGGGK